MNELEKQIEEASKVDNRFDDRYKSGFCIGFKAGANLKVTGLTTYTENENI